MPRPSSCLTSLSSYSRALLLILHVHHWGYTPLPLLALLTSALTPLAIKTRSSVRSSPLLFLFRDEFHSFLFCIMSLGPSQVPLFFPVIPSHVLSTIWNQPGTALYVPFFIKKKTKGLSCRGDRTTDVTYILSLICGSIMITGVIISWLDIVPIFPSSLSPFVL